MIRGVLKHQGEVNEVMGSLEWKTVGRMDGMTVTINSNDESVAVRVFSDLSGIAALTWVASIAIGLVAGGIVVDSLQPASLLVAASILGAGGTVGMGVDAPGRSVPDGEICRLCGDSAGIGSIGVGYSSP